MLRREEHQRHGRKGGIARSKKLSAERRSQIARQAALGRWKKQSAPEPAQMATGKQWLQFVGYINAHDLDLMKKAIEEDFETVYPDE